KRYEALALAEPDVIFVGRLATYRYYNMDQVVGQALATYRKTIAPAATTTAQAPIPASRPALFGRSGRTSSETEGVPAE
ncbi:hypothetical protein OZH72_22720, partial [Escherichia coli]|nr:hypothetical protein [Escherichia coli]